MVKNMEKSWNLNLSSLKELFNGHFMMGNIISPHDFKDEELLAMFKHHYNTVTAENAMKPVHITSAPGVYHFEMADKIVAWANDNDIKLIGHTLAWHGQSAPWLNRKEDGSPITRSEARANMETFVSTYVGRYAGKVYSWDVINETFRDGDGKFSGNWRDYLRRETENKRAVGHWFLAYENGADKDAGESGADYVFDVFYFARKADPAAVLYYNDYNDEMPVKRQAIAQMVEQINEQWKSHPEYDNRLLIEGIGMQGHYNHVHTKLENIRTALELYSATGAKIAVTELDFTLGSDETPSNPLSAEESKLQGQFYSDLFKLYMEFSSAIERVTFWGKDDGASWRSWGSPTLFSSAGKAKEAFHTIVATAKGIRLKPDCPCVNRDCMRHGNCDECEPAHVSRGGLPSCKRGK